MVEKECGAPAYHGDHGPWDLRMVEEETGRYCSICGKREMFF
jgi:hypothetical protein